jgi:type III restriction enzyme
MPKTAVEPDPAKKGFAIDWPNVVRIDHVYQQSLTLDWPRLRPLELDAAHTVKLAQLAPTIDGKPDTSKINQIDLEKLATENRLQRIIFTIARDEFDQMKHSWQGSREVLMAQLVRLVEQFIKSDWLTITPPLFIKTNYAAAWS